jgi:hypothetical protein
LVWATNSFGRWPSLSTEGSCSGRLSIATMVNAKTFGEPVRGT